MGGLNAFSNFIGNFVKANNKIIIFETKKVIEHVKVEVPKTLKLENEYYEYFKNKVINEKSSCFFHSNSDNFLEYFSTGIWKKNKCVGLIIIGPFLISEIDTIKLRSLGRKKPFSDEGEEVLKGFYKKLIHTETKSLNIIGELVINIDYENYSMPTFVEEAEGDKKNKLEKTINLKESEDITDLRYSYEEKFLNAITTGDEEKALSSYLTHMNYFDFTNRLPGKNIRMLKNGLIVMNTLSRKAAQRGGLPPKYLHSISDKFAIEIEKSNNLYFLKNLGVSIIKEYSQAVRDYSIKGYSKPIGKAIEFIHLNISKKIGLSEIADKTYINSSHLSRKFKEETGYTITEYINLKKVEKSKLLLQDGQSIKNVTFMLGFSEESYFNKVFKKSAGITPAKYLKSLNKNS